MIKVLIVDDSATVRGFLAHVLETDRGFRVIGLVGDGAAALEFIRRERPDVVTMDIDMPRMDGFEATRRVMETTPVPVVIVSGLSLQEQRATFRAFEAGALAVVPRPHGSDHPDFDRSAMEMINTVKAMAEVKVVRRWPKPGERETKAAAPVLPREKRPAKVIGIGASTGGPAALKTILSGLPARFPAPIVVVQHMTRGFLEGFATWLGSVAERRVEVAVEGTCLQAGCVYVAPENAQMGVIADGRIALTRAAELRSSDHCPSVSWLFRSLADSYGPSAVGILLTGMGRDGADSLKLMRERGAVTIAQAGETCVVNGMPAAAVQLEAAAYVLSPERITAALIRLAGDSPPQR